MGGTSEVSSADKWELHGVCRMSFRAGDHATIRYLHFCMVYCIINYAFICLFHGEVNWFFFFKLMTQTFLSLARWLLTPMAFVFLHVLTTLLCLIVTFMVVYPLSLSHQSSPKQSTRSLIYVVTLALKDLWISMPFFSVWGWWAKDAPVSRLPISIFLDDWGSLHLFVLSKSTMVIIMISQKKIYSAFYFYFVYSLPCRLLARFYIMKAFPLLHVMI